MPNRQPSRLFPSLSLAGRPLRQAALIAALAVTPLALAVTTTGAEFRVNVDTTGNQIPFGAVRLGTGDRVVAWSSNSPTGVGLYAQRYANDASPARRGVSAGYRRQQRRAQHQSGEPGGDAGGLRGGLERPARRLYLAPGWCLAAAL